MLFFALVYVVEGIGQIGGLISQPLTYYLKQAHGWTALQVTAYKHGALVSGMSSDIQKADLGDKGVWYRLARVRSPTRTPQPRCATS